jgi:hypothetical protein
VVVHGGSILRSYHYWAGSHGPRTKESKCVHKRHIILQNDGLTAEKQVNDQYNEEMFYLLGSYILMQSEARKDEVEICECKDHNGTQVCVWGRW